MKRTLQTTIFIVVFIFSGHLSYAQKIKMVSYKPIKQKKRIESIELNAGIGNDLSIFEAGVNFGKPNAEKYPKKNGINMRYYNNEEVASLQGAYEFEYYLYRPSKNFIILLSTSALMGYNVQKRKSSFSSLLYGITLGQAVMLNPKIPQSFYFKFGVQENLYHLGGDPQHFNLNFFGGIEFMLH